MLSRTQRELATIRDAYAALKDDVIPPDLRIDIHDLLAHYRAVLDYFAQEVAELCFPRPKLPQFLIARIDKDRATYTKELTDKFPGLQRASQELFDTLVEA